MKSVLLTGLLSAAAICSPLALADSTVDPVKIGVIVDMTRRDGHSGARMVRQG